MKSHPDCDFFSQVDMEESIKEISENGHLLTFARNMWCTFYGHFHIGKNSDRILCDDKKIFDQINQILGNFWKFKIFQKILFPKTNVD